MLAACFGVLAEREQFSKMHSGDDAIDPYVPKTFTSLDINHTHFVFVDDGSIKEFGGEVEFRAQYEHQLRERHGCPGLSFFLMCFAPLTCHAVVVIVIQGGPGTIKTALNAKRRATAIVIIEGSGKAADLLSYAWAFLHSPSFVNVLRSAM